MLQYPQTNTNKFLGMRSKNNYLIWREKNDFFSALSTKGQLVTWSLATCDMLYKQDALRNFNIDVRGNWEVYRANSKDETYCKKFYEF